MKTLFSVLLLTLVSISAHAAVVGTCEGLDSIGMLIGNPLSLANGVAKVAYVSTEEPAAHPDHILFFAYGDEDYVSCQSINAGPDQSGFSSIDFAHVRSSYNARTQTLSLTIPARVWTGDDGHFRNETVRARVDLHYPNVPPHITIR